MKFPKNFYWGAALSAMQYEGAYNSDNKGLSQIDISLAGDKKRNRFSTHLNKEGNVVQVPMMLGWESYNTTPYIDKNGIYPNQTAVDGYHKYQDDIEMLSEMGLKMLRISISWPRIFPNGNDEQPNEKGLTFYKNIFELCKKYGIEPLVTISHFDDPLSIDSKFGSWTNKEVIGMFEKYCRVLFDNYHKYVKYWLTFNEINITLNAPLFYGMPMTEEKANIIFNILHNKFVASALAVKYARDNYKDLKIGCMIGGGPSVYPYSCKPDDVMASLFKEQENYYCSDVMVKGKYPNFAERIWKEYGVKINFAPEEEKILKEGTVDFYSYSYYSSSAVSSDSSEEKVGGNFTKGVKNPYLSYSDWGWSFDAKGLRYSLNRIYDRYQIPIMVVENGLGAIDKLEDDFKVHDIYRIEYLKEHVKELDNAINKDSINVIAYTPWSAIDVVSAGTGQMSKRYGFVYVDKNDDGSGTFKRYKKDSFEWYKKVISSNGENLD